MRRDKRAAVEKQLEGALARLNNKAFTDKAPEQVVATARENAARLQEKLTQLDRSMALFG